MINLDFKHRMFLALLARSGVAGRRVTQGEIGKAVGKRLKKGSLTQAGASRHFGGRVPDVATVRAYAEEMGVDPGWLAFGEASKAPPPDVPASLLARPAGRTGKGRKKA